MISYPSAARALRAVERRREAYERTITARYAHCLQRYVLGPLEDELGTESAQFQGPTMADVLRPFHEHEALLAARIRARMRQLEPVFRLLHENTTITSLDTSAISTA